MDYLHRDPSLPDKLLCDEPGELLFNETALQVCVTETIVTVFIFILELIS